MIISNLQVMYKICLRIQSLGLSLILVVVLSLLSSDPVMAQANLQITPNRIIFDGKDRIMEFNLANLGRDSLNYNISFKQFRMTEDGTFEEITTPDPGQKFADKYIRFFPRSVNLGPNEKQVIKLQLTKSEQLEPGEYRSHIFFRSLKPLKALGEDNKNDTSKLSLLIRPTFGITAPVIIRVGESTTMINISDMRLEKVADSSKLQFFIHRTGNMSVYGDLLISHIAPNGKETKIGLYIGMAVYSPNTLRKVNIGLDRKSNVDLDKGTIRVLFTTRSDTKPIKLAEAKLDL